MMSLALYGKKQKAFTLIEMMLVVGIVAVLSSAVFVSLSAVESRRIKSQSLQLKQWLSNAEYEATLTGSTIGVAVSDERLLLVAPMSGRWFEIANIKPWRASEGVSIKTINAESQSNSSARTQNEIVLQLNPFLLIAPTGKLEVMRSLSLQSAAQEIVIISAQQSRLKVSL